jgi:hypothetical protein
MQCILYKIYFWKVFHMYYNLIFTPMWTKKIYSCKKWVLQSSSDSWVFDTGSLIHTCKSLQGLSLTRRFAKVKLDVHVWNGAKVATIAVGTFHLPLPSRLFLELNNCHCIPALCK